MAGTGPEHTKRILHTIEHPAQHINWGESSRRGANLGSGRGITQWVVSNCMVYHLVFPFHLQQYYNLPLLLYVVLFSFILYLNI